jgi:hypothetical protein
LAVVVIIVRGYLVDGFASLSTASVVVVWNVNSSTLKLIQSHGIANANASEPDLQLCRATYFKCRILSSARALASCGRVGFRQGREESIVGTLVREPLSISTSSASLRAADDCDGRRWLPAELWFDVMQM